MSLTFTLATMVCNELAETRDAMLGVFVRTTGRFDYTLLDNGSTNMVLDFMRRTLTPRPEVQDAVNFSFIRNAENAGSVMGLQQIYDATETDLLAVRHHVVWVHEDGEVSDYENPIDSIILWPFLGLWKESLTASY